MIHRCPVIAKQLHRAVRGFGNANHKVGDSRFLHDFKILHTAFVRPIAIGLHAYHPVTLPANRPEALCRKQRCVFIGDGKLLRYLF